MLASGACGGGDPGRILVGHEPVQSDGGSVHPPADAQAGTTGHDGSLLQTLEVHIEDVDALRVDVITVACAGDCRVLTAVASGGHPPYTFVWEDGSSSQERTVCPDSEATYSVTATDDGLSAPEFDRAPLQGHAEVSARVLQCPAKCDSDELGLPETLSPDIHGEPSYFHGGEPLPAGRYQLAYVDGCMRYQPEWDWTVQDLATNQFWIIGDGPSDILGLPPAQSSLAPLSQADFEDCVATNRRAAEPIELDFGGGKLGLWQNDFKPEDNVPGLDGRSPTWQLTRIDCE